MKSSQEDIALLEIYLKGRLSAEASAAIEDRLAAEADLLEDYKELKILTEGIRVSALNEKLSMLQDWENKHQTNPGKSIKWRKWLGLIFLVSMAGYLFYLFTLKEGKKVPVEYEGLYAQRFDEELILHKTKRAVVQTDSLSQEQRRAYEMYSIQLFDEAIPLLDDLWESKKDTLALFYLGVSRIGIGEKEAGLDILQRPELKKYSDQTNLFIHH